MSPLSDPDVHRAVISVILPLLPAFVIYKSLQRHRGDQGTTVSGPFKGFTIELSGAFAGYFIIMISLLSYFAFRPIKEAEVWTIEGTIVTESPNDLGFLQILAMPPTLELLPNGQFSFLIPVIRDHVGLPRFPALIVQHPKYQPMTLSLNQASTFGETTIEVSRNELNRQITVNRAIRLKPIGQ